MKTNILILFQPILLSLFLTFFLSFYWPKLLSIFNFLKIYKASHKIHDNEISRLGGLVIFIFIFNILFYIENSTITILILKLLFFSLPIVIIAIKEDIFHNSKISNRFICMIISSTLAMLYIDHFPVIDLSFFTYLQSTLDNFEIIFYILCCIVVINGTNFIDGINGLLSLTVIFQILSLIFLSNEFLDRDILEIAIYLLLPILIFTAFNFPFGKIFIGDLGAYFLGFIIALIVIMFFGRHDKLSYINAILIFIYPAFELFFSFFRKILLKKNPFHPDKEHLHTKVYLFLNNMMNSSFKSNIFAISLLSPFWLGPFLFIIYFYENTRYLILAIFIFIITYVLYYFLFNYLGKKYLKI